MAPKLCELLFRGTRRRVTLPFVSDESSSTWPPRAPYALASRRSFSKLSARAFLAHCAISPPSDPVRRAIAQVSDSYAEQGVAAFPLWLERRDQFRIAAAQFLGAAVESIGFSANTTTAIVTIAQGFPWQPGDHLLLFDGEFPTNVTPWQQAAERYGLKILRLPAHRWLEDPAAANEALERLLSDHPVRLLAISAVQFQNGLRVPLDEIVQIAHRHETQVFCDAIQALGSLPLDVSQTKVDYLAAGSHKWMMGIEGAALLYIAPEHLPKLRPVLAGWLSHEDPVDFLFETDKLRYDRPIRKRADFIESGAQPVIALAALETALNAISTLGVDAIFDHIQGYHDHIEAKLLERGFTSLRGQKGQRSGILALTPPAGWPLQELVQHLGERGITTSAPDGCWRIAPHWPNHLSEIDEVMDAVDSFARNISR